MPKSANVFVAKTIELTVNYPICRLVENDVSRFNHINGLISAERLSQFFALRSAVGGQHIRAENHNLRLLEVHAVKKIALLFRDPRDALLSWQHHLERADIKEKRLRIGGADQHEYYKLEREDKLRCLVTAWFPALQEWMNSWLRIADTASTLTFYINRYEDLAQDQHKAIRNILAFFGHLNCPILPALGNSKVNGIDVGTHFRRGLVGSFREEVPQELVNVLNKQLDRRLAERMGWN